VKINSSKRKLSSNWFPCSSAKLSFLVVRKSLVAGIFVVFLVLYVFCTALCGCTKFLAPMGRVPIHEKGEDGPDLCVWGMLSPKLDSKCGRSLRG
jgi:hypothetical protein